MTNKPSKEKYVTEFTFKKESNWVHKEFDWVHKEFDWVHKEFESVHREFGWVRNEFGRVHLKIDNVALAVVNINERLERVENTMATKSDINLILDRIDHLSKSVSIFDQEERVQSLHLQEVKGRVADHEKRLTLLESSR